MAATRSHPEVDREPDAESFLRLAESAPGDALRRAREVLSVEGLGSEERCLALHALSVACLQLGQLAEARRYVSAGLALASEAALPARLAELRATSALLWFHAEAPGRALAELDSAAKAAPQSSAATLRGQRAHLLFRLGRFDEGLAETERALAAATAAAAGLDGPEPAVAPGTTAAGDPTGRHPWSVMARILTNRALARSYRGHHDEAVSDLEQALVLHRSSGAEALATQTLHNLAFVSARLGDLPRALHLFERATKEYEQLGMPVHQLMVDFAAVLLDGRLIPEARNALVSAAEMLDDAGYAVDAAEARLALADACIAAGDLVAARAAARSAGAAFSRQHRDHWVALADEIPERAHRSALTRSGDWAAFVDSATASAVRLLAAGWPAEALRAAVEAARLGITCDRSGTGSQVGVDTARAVSIAAEAEDRCASRLQHAHVEALRLAAAGDRLAALDVAAGALDSAAAARRLGLPGPATASAEPSDGATFGVLRRPGAFDLAASGLAIALRHRSPEQVLEWAERCRSERSHSDRSARSGTTDHGDLVAGSHDAAGLRRRLARRDLVEFVTQFGRVHAVVVSEERAELLDCGPAVEIDEHRSALLFAMRRLVATGARPTDASTAAAMSMVLSKAAHGLEAPLRPVIDSLGGRAREVLIVPSGPLLAVPWGALPSFGRFAVTVVPSAAETPPSEPLDPRRVLLVAGPGLSAAQDEIERLAELWAGSNVAVHVLTGDAACRASVLDALGRCDIAHLAVHGRLRADHPAMSSLELSDRPLSLQELGGSGVSPECLVLSACDAGRDEPAGADDDGWPGNGVLAAGAAATTTATATRPSYLVASVGPLLETAMPAVSAAFHDRLAAGDPPARALQRARAQATSPGLGAPDSPVATAAEIVTAGLVCHGAASPRMQPAGLPGARASGLGESSS